MHASVLQRLDLAAAEDLRSARDYFEDATDPFEAARTSAAAVVHFVAI